MLPAITKKQKDALKKRLEKAEYERACLEARRRHLEMIKIAREEIKKDSSDPMYPYENCVDYADTYFYKGRFDVSKRTRMCLKEKDLYTRTLREPYVKLVMFMQDYDRNPDSHDFTKEELAERVLQDLGNIEDPDNLLYVWQEDFVLYCSCVDVKKEGCVFTFIDPFDTIKTKPTTCIPLPLVSRMPNEYVQVRLRYYPATKEFELREVHDIIETGYAKMKTEQKKRHS